MSFEKLRVYQAAVLLDQEVRRLGVHIDRGHASDLDHLKRAVGSILFNIPEANGSTSPGRKHYHLEVARGSADECRAVLKRLVANGALAPREVVKANGLTSAIAKMLTAMMRFIKHPAT